MLQVFGSGQPIMAEVNDEGSSCAVDGSGNVYLAGSTHLPLYCFWRASKYFGGGYDAFLVKFNPAGVRQWATYYGGNGDDKVTSCTVDGSGNVYLAGDTYTTTSTSSIADGGHQNTYGGGIM